MAVFLFLVAIIGGVVVGDLVLENPAAGEVTVFNQPVNGYSQGSLLAVAATLGFVVAVLLVASVSSTRARRTRRKQLRNIRAGNGRGSSPSGNTPACRPRGSAANRPKATWASRPGRATSGVSTGGAGGGRSQHGHG